MNVILIERPYALRVTGRLVKNVRGTVQQITNQAENGRQTDLVFAGMKGVGGWIDG